MLYWITGLSGAGKTTIGKALYARLKQINPAVVFLDGDELRSIVGDRFGYSIEERKECSMFYSRLCKCLTDQGLDVICCVCAMFDCVRKCNRENIPDYMEVYVKTSREVLLERDQKSLYSGFQIGEASQVMGMDLQMEEPKRPDIIIENNGNISVEECVTIILNGVNQVEAW